MPASAGAEPVRVAHLIEQLAPGGAEGQLIALLSGLSEHSVQPMVIAGHGSGFMVDRVRELGVPLRILRSSPGQGVAGTIGAIRELRRFQPHIIHGWSFIPNSWGAIARPLLPHARLVAGVRGKELLTPMQVRVERVLRRVPDAIVSNTRYFADQWRASGVSASKLVVIPNGIELSPPATAADRTHARGKLGVPSDALLVGMVGSFRPVKRWDVFLEAAAMLPESPDLQIAGVGDGPLLPTMVDKARQLGLESRTTFYGEREDAADVVGALDVLVSASDSEGFSNTILEAMAAGVPVVATAVGGTPELVVDGETGLLVPPGRPDSMAAVLERLLGDPDLRLRLGQAGRRRAEEEFSVETMTRRTVDLYCRLLSPRR